MVIVSNSIYNQSIKYPAFILKFHEIHMMWYAYLVYLVEQWWVFIMFLTSWLLPLWKDIYIYIYRWFGYKILTTYFTWLPSEGKNWSVFSELKICSRLHLFSYNFRKDKQIQYPWIFHRNFSKYLVMCYQKENNLRCTWDDNNAFSNHHLRSTLSCNYDPKERFFQAVVTWYIEYLKVSYNVKISWSAYKIYQCKFLYITI